MTASGRAIRFILLIVGIGLLVWMTTQQPRPTPSSGG